MKKIICFFLTCVLALSLLGCECKHEWIPATCTTAATCSKCGTTQGEPLGHQWENATCTQPQTCQICGTSTGNALGHNWNEATCTEPKTCATCGQTEGDLAEHEWEDATCSKPKTCSICGATEGEAMPHTWIDATCTEAKTCNVCGKTEGKALGHSVENWEIESASTCTKPGIQTGVCTICEETVSEELPLAEHIPGEWEVTVEPTPEKDGEHVKKCTNCGKVLEKEKFSLSPEEIKALYIQKCSAINYDDISRYPGNHKGDYVSFRGKILQVCSEAESSLYYSTYRISTSGSYDNVVMLMVDNYGTGERILEDDWVTVYGRFTELYSYKTVMGATLTIPEIIAEYIER